MALTFPGVSWGDGFTRYSEPEFSPWARAGPPAAARQGEHLAAAAGAVAAGQTETLSRGTRGGVDFEPAAEAVVRAKIGNVGRVHGCGVAVTLRWADFLLEMLPVGTVVISSLAGAWQLVHPHVVEDVQGRVGRALDEAKACAAKKH